MTQRLLVLYRLEVSLDIGTGGIYRRDSVNEDTRRRWNAACSVTLKAKGGYHSLGSSEASKIEANRSRNHGAATLEFRRSIRFGSVEIATDCP